MIRSYSAQVKIQFIIEFKPFKKYQMFGCPCCSSYLIVKSFHRCINFYFMTGFDVDKVFFGVRTDRRTDRHEFGVLVWKYVGTQKKKTQISKLGVNFDKQKYRDLEKFMVNNKFHTIQ